MYPLASFSAPRLRLDPARNKVYTLASPYSKREYQGTGRSIHCSPYKSLAHKARGTGANVLRMGRRPLWCKGFIGVDAPRRH